MELRRALKLDMVHNTLKVWEASHSSACYGLLRPFPLKGPIWENKNFNFNFGKSLQKNKKLLKNQEWQQSGEVSSEVKNNRTLIFQKLEVRDLLEKVWGGMRVSTEDE